MADRVLPHLDTYGASNADPLGDLPRRMPITIQDDLVLSSI